MIREVIQQNNPILRAGNEEISAFNGELNLLIKDMFDTMKAFNLAGLAAPQIGINKRVFVAENTKTIDKEDGTKEKILEHFVFINPRIVAFSEATEERYEGCGSVQEAQVFGLIERPKRATVEALDEKGEAVHLKSSGFFARVIQHETDHLNGILFTDKLKPGSKLITKDEYLGIKLEN